MKQFSNVESSAASAVGLSVADIRSYSPGQLRDHLERKNRKRFSFVSEFPFIGRGNVLRDSLTDTDSLNSEIDKILR